MTPAYLCAAVRILLPTEADKDRVRHLDQNVIDAVNVRGFDASLLHVFQNAVLTERTIQTAVPV